MKSLTVAMKRSLRFFSTRLMTLTIIVSGLSSDVEN